MKARRQRKAELQRARRSGRPVGRRREIGEGVRSQELGEWGEIGEEARSQEAEWGEFGTGLPGVPLWLGGDEFAEADSLGSEARLGFDAAEPEAKAEDELAELWGDAAEIARLDEAAFGIAEEPTELEADFLEETAELPEIETEAPDLAAEAEEAEPEELTAELPKTETSTDLATLDAVETGEETELDEDELPEAPSWFQSKEQAMAAPPLPPDGDDGVQVGPLPYRGVLESRLGCSLGHVQVYSGVRVQGMLTQLQARAVTWGSQIFLGEPRPELAVVTHEVLHVLQGTPAAAVRPVPLPDSAPAEREAQALTAILVPQMQASQALPWRPVEVRSQLSSHHLAPLREAPPATTSPAAPPEEVFEAAATERPPPARGPPTAAETEATTDTGTQAAPDLGENLAPIDGELETVPALEPPAPPEPGITEADVAAREAELAAAEAALASAADVDEKVDAFADAPPSLKAQEHGSLDRDLNDLATAESEEFQGELPEFEAKLSGDVEPPEELQVAAPEGETGDLEDGPPPPAPDPDIPPTPEPEAYTGNSDLLRTITRLVTGTGNSPQDRASDIGDTLRDVRTTDEEVDTSPGAAPEVPQEGETDPSRINEQLETGSERATSARDEAQQGVLTGPGPEQVQPLVLEEPVPLEELNAPELVESPPVEGVDSFTQREMPPEVDTAFDLENQDAMSTSFGEAKTQMRQATEERDRNRQDAVDTAEADAETATQQADQDQRDQVQEQRQRIQDERQGTLEAQSEAVRKVESDAETRRRDDRSDIDGRVSRDQETIRDDYAEGEEKAEDKVRDGERKAEDERDKAEREAENESWWDRAVSFVQRAFEALTSAISAIFDAVREAVNKLLDEIKAAALRLIELAADFIKGAIAAFGEFLKGLVDGLLGDIFPGLAAALTGFIDAAVELAQQAVDAVANTLKDAVNAIVEGLRAGLNAVLDALQAGLEFVSSLIQAALAGDWGEVIRLLLEAVLKVVGIEPETFYGFIGRAQDTLQKILDDPGAVVSNLLDAVKLGIQKFADNFLPHLQAGIIGWLTGALGSDIQMPTEFNLLGLLDLARQILGLTLQFIRRIAVRLIGEENVERIESLLGYVETLITGGWSALFEQIMQDLSGIKDMVIEQIKEFLVTRLILAAITKLVSLFNPIGAIVQLVLTAWNIYTFLRDNLQRLIQIVQTIVEGISNIVNGNLEPAANGIESTLANLLPVAISFLMNLLGIGGVANRVRQIIGRVRERIENAIVNFIRRIGSRIASGRSRRGAATERGAEGRPEGDTPAPEGPDTRTAEQKQADLETAITRAEEALVRPNRSLQTVENELRDLKRDYRLLALDAVEEDKSRYYVEGRVNPRRQGRRVVVLLDPDEQAQMDQLSTTIASELDRTGHVGEFRDDPEGYIENLSNSPVRVRSGDIVEQVGLPLLQRYARQNNYTIWLNAGIQVIDRTGTRVGQEKNQELDGMLLGSGQLIEIVSAKLSYDQVDRSDIPKVRNFYYNRPLARRPMTMSKQRDIQRRFGFTAASLGQVDFAQISYDTPSSANRSIPLEDFQSQYRLSATVGVLGLTPISDSQTSTPAQVDVAGVRRLTVGLMTGLTRQDLIRLTAEAVTAKL